MNQVQSTVRFYKIFVGFLGIFSCSTFAADGSSGCGAGWYLTQRNSLVSSSFRSLTNATFSNTSGMTSGTSGCAKHDLVKQDKASEHYAEANFQNLMVEMAQGDGEHLRTFAAVLGCVPGVYGNFSGTLQKNYPQIFKSEQTQPHEMLESVKSELRLNLALTQGCVAVI